MTVQPAHSVADVALPTVTGGDLPGLAVLRDWLTAAASAQQLVAPLVDSAFVPLAYKPRVDPRASAEEKQAAYQVAVANATSAVLLGMGLGIDPLTALQQIYIVHGRPGMYAKIKVALAQARGHRVWDEVYSADRAVVCGHRAGTPDDHIVRIEITMEDAKRAGWTTNDAYRKTPADMLWSRAASRVVDRIASDVLHGIASIEDLQDAPEPTPVTSRVTVDDLPKVAPRAVEAPPEKAPAPVAEAPQAPAEPVVEQVTPAPDAEKLRRAVGEAFTKLKVSGPGMRERRARLASHIVGRDVASAAEMTADELQMVLDNLTADLVAEVEREAAAAEQAPEPAPQQEWPPVAVADPTGGDPWGPREFGDDYDPNGPAEDGPR